MTVASEVSQSTYTGNASTVAFPTVFRFIRNSEVVVKVTPSGGTETIYTEGLGYDLTGAGDDSGGTVTFAGAPASGSAIVIERTVPLTQPIPFTTQGRFDAKTHEEAFDEKVFALQQLARRITALEAVSTPGDFVAGDGLEMSGSTCHVRTGTGIKIESDQVALDVDVATPAEDGLMSAEDKALLDALVAGADTAVAQLQTTTVTEATAATLTLVENSVECIEVTTVASKKTGTDCASWTHVVTAKRKDNVVAIAGLDAIAQHMTLGTWNARITASGSTLVVLVTGGAYSVDWAVYARRRTRQS